MRRLRDGNIEIPTLYLSEKFENTAKKGDVLKLKQARGGGFAVSLMAK